MIGPVAAGELGWMAGKAGNSPTWPSECTCRAGIRAGRGGGAARRGGVIPPAGEPADVAARVREYGDWMHRSADVPKPLMTVTPAQEPGSAGTIASARENEPG